MNRRPLVALLCLLVLSLPATGRVLSYAPYTNRLSVPSIHARNSRYFALTESLPGSTPAYRGQVVLYDTTGREEPRVIYPVDQTKDARIVFVALYERNEEGRSGSLSILIEVVRDPYTYTQPRDHFISNDAGATWKRVDGLDADQRVPQWYQFRYDFGGPFSLGLSSQVSVGGTLPFVIGTGGGRVYGITLDGKARLLHEQATSNVLIGRNREGSRFIVRTGKSANGLTIGVIGTNASSTPTPLGEIPGGFATGWLTPDGCAYVQVLTDGGRVLYSFCDGKREEIGKPYAPVTISDATQSANDLAFFAVPTTNYDGAWMIRRAPGKPTTLSRNFIGGGTEILWSDPSQPQVEALHTGEDPEQLLIQVHRGNADQQRSFLDPALATWHTGQPAPTEYQELFLNEGPSKSLLHADVDHIADGAPFVFDSGGSNPAYASKSPVESEAAGGADVGQEWGVVRASFRQRLVIPGVARQQGAFGSRWQTDVVLHNPLDTPQTITLRLVPIETDLLHDIRQIGSRARETDNAPEVVAPQFKLEAHEIRVVSDVLKSMFNIDSGGGTLYIDPQSEVSATSRTYTRTANNGTFGLGMPAIDFYNVASPRFPALFSGAFPGANFRTNVLLTDTGKGTAVHLIAHGGSGVAARSDLSFGAASGTSVLQLTEISSTLDATEGGLEVRPERGSLIPTVVAIDNKTNDPTWFPPDLPAFTVRTIPMIVHATAANGAQLRTDLFLMNPATYDNSINFEIKPWSSNDAPRTTRLALAPGQSLVIRDALAYFGLTGFARIRYTSGIISDPGVRVTSRTYAENADGGTYGTVVPPLNSFQSASPGESLEILGVTGESGFHATLSLIDLNAMYDGHKAEAKIHVFNEYGLEIDSFDVAFPIAGGMQVDSIFRNPNLAPPKAALIRVEVKSGLVAAFATLTDNVTNDATYLAASLGAKAK
jgi:hypothetical protein